MGSARKPQVPPPRPPGLQLVEAPESQLRVWRAQRTAWVSLVILMILGLLGVFGNGPLDRMIDGPSGGPLRIEHPRFGRLGVEETFRFHLAPKSGREARVWIDRRALLALPIQQILPQPVRVEAGAEGESFIFATQYAAHGVEVDFRVRPARIGRIAGRAGVEREAAVEFEQFVYP